MSYERELSAFGDRRPPSSVLRLSSSIYQLPISPKALDAVERRGMIQMLDHVVRYSICSS
jgi:hypothetical protein